jgi:hypothetical protein
MKLSKIEAIVEKQLAIQDLDKEIDALFRKQEELKKSGKDGSPEYMQVLYKLRDLTRQRIGQLGE